MSSPAATDRGAARAIIRPACACDAAAAAETVAASIRGLCRADHHDDPDILARWLADKTTADFTRRIAGPARMFVAEEAGLIMAVGEVDATQTGPARITLNYVSPAHRRRGLGQAMLATLEQALVGMGHRRAALTATTTARAFYLAHGWQVAGPPRQGRWILGHPMSKALAPPCP